MLDFIITYVEIVGRKYLPQIIICFLKNVKSERNDLTAYLVMEITLLTLQLANIVLTDSCPAGPI